MNLVDRALGIEVTAVKLSNVSHMVVVKGMQKAAPILRLFVAKEFEAAVIPIHGGSSVEEDYSIFEIRSSPGNRLVGREFELQVALVDYLTKHMRQHGDEAL